VNRQGRDARRCGFDRGRRLQLGRARLPAGSSTAMASVLKKACGRPSSPLYLPPYSPDFNPIEQLFAKLKALLRKAAERSVDGLWNRIASLLDAFQPNECANYFRNAGYAS
jgi:transposase